MRDIKKPTSVGRRGLETWDIALLSVRDDGENTATVETATDEEFQAFVTFNNIRVNSQGIDAWCFDDRCGVIQFALQHAIILRPMEKKNDSVGELFEGHEPAIEGTPTQENILQ